MRDFSEEIADLARRAAEAHKYLRIDDARARLADLEQKASAPDLWDDADRARAVTSEMSTVREDVELVDELERRLSDVETLYELARDEDDEPMALPTEQVQQQPVRAEKTPGRNEPCHCGSGKKYKLCHGR